MGGVGRPGSPRWWGYSHPHSRAAAHLVFWLLVAGVVGALWWWFKGRHAPVRPAGVRILQGVVAGLAVTSILVGTAWRSVTDLGDAPVCAAPPGEEWGSTSDLPGLTPSLWAQKVATWPETGLAMLYADARGLTVCRYAAADYYVAVVAEAVAGKRTVNFGDMVISPRFPTVPSDAANLAEHESHHRPQWAVATLLAGPAAFPVAYGIDDFFFPGARNHFERLAGLELGGYVYVGSGPVIGTRQVVAIGVVVLGAGGLAVRRVRSRRAG